eukprot:528172_1
MEKHDVIQILKDQKIFVKKQREQLLEALQSKYIHHINSLLQQKLLIQTHITRKYDEMLSKINNSIYHYYNQNIKRNMNTSLNNIDSQSDNINNSMPDTLSLNTSSSQSTKQFQTDKIWKCDKCNYATNRKYHFTRHSRIHSEYRPFKCDKCTKAFKRRETLRKHQKTHSNIRPFKCKQCDKAFKQKWDLNIHIRRIHNKEKNFQCNFCKKQFFHKNDWLTHNNCNRNINGEFKGKKHKCEQCNYATNSKSHFNRHYVVHSEERPFKCEKCNKRFKQKTVLESHQFTHTNERLFKCDQCNRSYKTEKNLKVHIRNIHNNERNFECNICHKAFFSKRSWECHGEKGILSASYKCDVCGEIFNQKSCFNYHRKIHPNTQKSKQKAIKTDKLVEKDRDQNDSHDDSAKSFTYENVFGSW